MYHTLHWYRLINSPFEFKIISMFDVQAAGKCNNMCATTLTEKLCQYTGGKVVPLH